jgi:hypothetical protein
VPVQAGDDLAPDANRVRVALGNVVHQPGHARVHLRAAQHLVLDSHNRHLRNGGPRNASPADAQTRCTKPGTRAAAVLLPNTGAECPSCFRLQAASFTNNSAR